MSEGKCRDCHDLILWVEMTGGGLVGKNRALDPVPKLGGDVERKQGKASGKWYGQIVPRDPTVRRYVMHKPTCAGAQQARMRR